MLTPEWKAELLDEAHGQMLKSTRRNSPWKGVSDAE
jgi:hypothetical protein